MASKTVLALFLAAHGVAGEVHRVSMKKIPDDRFIAQRRAGMAAAKENPQAKGTGDIVVTDYR
jgi:hypothetical protein